MSRLTFLGVGKLVDRGARPRSNCSCSIFESRSELLPTTVRARSSELRLGIDTARRPRRRPAATWRDVLKRINYEGVNFENNSVRRDAYSRAN